MFLRAALFTVLGLGLVVFAGPSAAADDGWRDLLKPGSLEGWTRGDGKPAALGAWQWEGDVLTRAKAGAGDLVSAEEFGDCEIEFEWRATPGANGGLKYRLRRKGKAWIGCEYQILDDERHSNGKVAKTSAASLYDVLAPDPAKLLRPPGEWNHSRIVAAGTAIEHWLNGKLVLKTEFGSEEWRKAVAASKFRGTADFGAPGPGRVLIQDHGDVVSLRKLRLRAR
jgi:hypothetical protein